MNLNNLQTFESWSDKDLDNLKDFGRSYGIIKRRVKTGDLEFSNEFGEEVNDELDFLDDWTGNKGERVEEVSGYVMKDEIDIDISLDNGYHIRFDFMSAAMTRTNTFSNNDPAAVIKIFEPGTKLDPIKNMDVTVEFLENQTDAGNMEAIISLYAHITRT